jgi:hypothetical protein
MTKIARDPSNLNPTERAIYLSLPAEVAKDYLATLPLLEAEKPNAAARKRRSINNRIRLLKEVVAACEKQITQLNIAWGELGRGTQIDLRPLLRSITVEGATVTFARQPEDEEKPPARGNGTVRDPLPLL